MALTQTDLDQIRGVVVEVVRVEIHQALIPIKRRLGEVERQLGTMAEALCTLRDASQSGLVKDALAPIGRS